MYRGTSSEKQQVMAKIPENRERSEPIDRIEGALYATREAAPGIGDRVDLWFKACAARIRA